jgi:ribonuclease Z
LEQTELHAIPISSERFWREADIRRGDMALDYGHLTAAKAAKLAAAAGVKRLALTHISGRYSDGEILAEATKIFPNSRVAADLDRLAV